MRTKEGESFSDMVRKARVTKGLTLRQLEEASGIKWSLLNMVETGNRSPTLEVAYALGEVLSIPEEKILSAACQARIDGYAGKEKASLDSFLREKKISSRT